MKTYLKIISSFLIIGCVIYSCKGKKAEKELEKIETEVEVTNAPDPEYEFSKKMDSLNIVPNMSYKPTAQSFETVSVNRRRSYTHYKPVIPTSKFNETKIFVTIPVTNANDSIVSVVDASSTKVNTIVVFIKSINGTETLSKPITNLLKSEFEIAKITGLNKTRLEEDKQLRVIVFYNHIFYDSHLTQFNDCISKTNRYQTIKCGVEDPKALFDKWNFTEEDIEKYKKDNQPLEEDGSIIGFSL